MGTAARASILAAFTSGQGYCADADYSPRAWLIHKTGVTRGAAVAYTAWVRRAAAHPLVAAALAAGEMSESFARMICAWTGKLPQDCRPDADEILLLAAQVRDGAAGPGRAGRRRSTPGPCPRTRTTSAMRRSRTGRCGWRPPSTAPGCCMVT